MRSLPICLYGHSKPACRLFIQWLALLLATTCFWVGGSAEGIADVFLNITSLTPTTGTGASLVQGGFSGTLAGVDVTGVLSGTNTSNFRIRDVGTSFEQSTMDDNSTQYSYSDIYSPRTPRADRIGYTFQNGGTLTPRLTITFSTPVFNPVFHVANLDSMTYTFVNSTGGLTSLLLLSGNGGTDNDGLKVSGLSIMDANPSTIVSQGPDTHPNMTGSRSAYGSVKLLGTISQLEINLSRAGSGDGGSFTLSVVPEPGSLAVLGIITACGIARQRHARRRARVSP